MNTRKELKDTCVAEVLTKPLAVDVGSCRIWPMGEGSRRRSLLETNTSELLQVVEVPAAVKIVYVPSGNASGAEEKQEISGNNVGGNEGTSVPNFVAGDVLQFVDCVNTDLFDDGNSTKFRQENCIEVLQVGTSGKYDGWLEVRAARIPTGFVARGWLNPRVKGAWILGPS